MDLIDAKTVFNHNFNLYNKDNNSDYLNRLLNYAISIEDIEDSVTARIDEFQSKILEYVISKDSEQDFESDIDEVRKERADDLLYDINNYLMSMEPYDAVKTFIECDFKKLIIEAQFYCNTYRKNIIDKINSIISNTKIEYDNNISYSKALNDLIEHIHSRNNRIIFYDSMCKYMTDIKKDTPLKVFDEYTDSLLIESTIINKFKKDGRVYINSVITKNIENPEDPNSIHYFANICESVLTNYVMLDLYSKNPESLIISDRMLESILMEVELGTVTKNDVLLSIKYGPVNFTKEEIDYIEKTFMKRLFHREDKEIVEKSDLIKLIK